MKKFLLAALLCGVASSAFGQAQTFSPVSNGQSVIFVPGNDVVGGPAAAGVTFTGSITGTTLNAPPSGTQSPPVLTVGTVITGAGVTAGTVITAYAGGYNWTVNNSQTIAAETLTAGGAAGSIMDSSFLATPVYASGGCTTTPAIAGNPTAFTLTNGASGCSGNTITLTMPAAAHKWICNVHSTSAPTTEVVEQSASASPTSVQFTNYTRTTGAVLTWTGGEILIGACAAY